ncbi:hypothetical protein FACS1894201_10650 [Bacteroidia bacterium]|nr:hypothetical protein FACS1894201_10650 [Bacteroidia bacterium]
MKKILILATIVALAVLTTSCGGRKTNGSIYNPDGIEMVYVEGSGSGIFSMPGFYIGKYEVTQQQWEAVMGSNTSRFKGANRPVEQVSWNDAQTFIRKLNSMTGRNYLLPTYRLPTEKEWAYAAGEGNRNSTYKYSGSDNIGDVAWYEDNSGDQTHNVGTKSANALGIYDMSGNVWEWCEDWSDDRQQYRVFRGGSWTFDASLCTVSTRFYTLTIRTDGLGFRLVLVP